MSEELPIGFLIDPYEKTVSIVDIGEGGLEVIRKHINVAWVDAVRISPQLTMWIDDEGLYQPNQKFFAMKTFATPFAGKALIVPAHAETEEVIKTEKDKHDDLLRLVKASVMFLDRDEALVLAEAADKEVLKKNKQFEDQGFTVINTSIADAIRSGVYTEDSN